MEVRVNNKTFAVEEHVIRKDIERCFNIFYNGEHISTYTTFNSTEDEIAIRLEKYLFTFNSKEELLSLLETEEALPKHLKKSIKYCISEGKLTELLEAFMIDFHLYRDRIISLISKVALIINKPYHEVLKLTDYNYKDIRWYRLSDAFAELRIIILLDQKGFTNIQLLRAINDNKQVEINAGLLATTLPEYTYKASNFSNIFVRDIYKINFNRNIQEGIMQTNESEHTLYQIALDTDIYVVSASKEGVIP